MSTAARNPTQARMARSLPLQDTAGVIPEHPRRRAVIRAGGNSNYWQPDDRCQPGQLGGVRRGRQRPEEEAGDLNPRRPSCRRSVRGGGRDAL